LLGIKLSSDLEERDLEIKRAYVIGNESDAKAIMGIVMELTGISSDEVSDLKESFPDSVESEA